MGFQKIFTNLFSVLWMAQMFTLSENAPLPGVQFEVLQNNWNRLELIVNRGKFRQQHPRVGQPLLAIQRFAELNQ